MRTVVLFFLLLIVFSVQAQEESDKKSSKATFLSKAVYVKNIPPLAGRRLIPAVEKEGPINERRGGGLTRVIPGKGTAEGQGQQVELQRNTATREGRAPSIVFQANARSVSPTDPTGAIGPNHYVSAINSAFAIHDRSGNVLVPSTSLGNIFPGETLGDPIVFYDNFADRFVITQFSDTPNGFLVAICQGSDPVNDGWFTYRFNTGTFPDYTKFSIWSDGYYVTANKDQGTANSSLVVFAIERDLMLLGDENAQIVGFPLPGIINNGFFSPASFNATGSELPPRGNVPLIYLQDDSWAGVSEDHLKLWNINVDWTTLSNSVIIESQTLGGAEGVTPFDSVFNGGAFNNLPQPETSISIDAIQATIMYATNYRRFCDYNSVVLNFVVDIDERNNGNSEDIAGIRWYELRQAGDNQPWTVYQEGTYTSPDGKSAWCASMGMDVHGNIGMAYTTLGTTANLATENSFTSLRYTGRLHDDTLGVMTIAEQDISIGTGPDLSTQSRYGDYSHLSIDPLDNETFWFIGEHHFSNTPRVRDIVGAFNIAQNGTNNSDVRVLSIDSPINNTTLTNTESIIITIKNEGLTAVTSVPVSYNVDGGSIVNETYTGSIAAGGTDTFTFSQTADLSQIRKYKIRARTNLAGDEAPQNDCLELEVTSLAANDIGVSSITAPETGSLTNSEQITISLRNFGTAVASNFSVSYSINGATPVQETVNQSVNPSESIEYTFTTNADLSIENQSYEIEACTALLGDANSANNCATKTVVNRVDLCQPAALSGCNADGIKEFILGDISAGDGSLGCNTEPETSPRGYADRRDLSTNLDRTAGNNEHLLQARTMWGQNIDPPGGPGDEGFAIWIDFDDSGSFEASELLLDTTFQNPESLENFTLSIPTDAPLGIHTLRAKAIDITGGDVLTNPCANFDFGEVQDYNVVITDNNLSTTELDQNKSKFYIATKANDQFEVVLISDYNQNIYISVYNANGQQLVYNIVPKTGDRFVYNLDMSYASSGVYFVKMGTKQNTLSGKLIVE